MARILSIDYGLKRTGLAVTDPLQIIVTPLATVSTDQLFDFLKEYTLSEEVEEIVLGEPGVDGEGSHISSHIRNLYNKLIKTFPAIKIVLHDENFTSVRAKEILMLTAKKTQRRKKELVDKVSAILILQSYLKHI